MTSDLFDVLARFSSLRALVIGEAILDTYLRGTSTRLCREAPAPIVDIHEREDDCGGAANTAANVRALGADVSLLTVLGEDADGARLIGCLGRSGVRLDDAIAVPGRATLSKQRVVAGPQLMLRFDTGTTSVTAPEVEARVIAALRRRYREMDVVIVSDYGYGVLTPNVVAALTELQRSTPRVLFVDSRHLSQYRQAGVTAVKPNFEEAVALLGGSIRVGVGDRVQTVLGRAARLLTRVGAQYVAVTLDVDGAVILDRDGGWYRTYANAAPDARAAGAGDTFSAAFALGLGAGATMPAAAEVARAAAQAVVERDGTTVCTLDDVRAGLLDGGKILEDRRALLALVNAHRQAGRRVVFTNGCFDIVHRGHVTYLSQAKALGDVLIVGVNADESVRRLKGTGRPVNALEDRQQVLAALSSVDHVIAFEEDTPEALIRLIGPDIVAKGGDYSDETLPEAALVRALGGEVRFLPYIEGASTTGLIAQIRSVSQSAAG
ncbi:MAG: D-glycero-beta-D-manno-heptose 1-phosphate adenylyltransferase [Chloroflexi bacterium]|nr:D-glycero-beta-D-manno-heptose 1-phosphate adenylyltransferase [Chloroflexota bacterium]